MSTEEDLAKAVDMGSQAPAVRRSAGHHEGSPRVCPRCGSPIPVRVTRRPARWCSQRCRRVAYEERRAAAAGAIAVEVVETVTTTEHGLDECVCRVHASPVAVRKILAHVTKLVVEDGLHDPKWGSTLTAVLHLSRQMKTHR